MKVWIFGAGKVGRALGRGLARAGEDVTLRPARKGLPSRTIDASVLLLAVRDGDLASVASELAASGVVPRKAVVLHHAGALSAEVLAPLRAVCAGVAQMHPMMAFASPSFVPTLAGGAVHVQGDPQAEARARRLVRRLGMKPVRFARLDPVGYHAAAGLVANGATALAALGAQLLVRAGVPAREAPRLLGPLLRSVAENVEALGLPDALTGPVRRGDAATLARQLAVVGERLPAAAPLLAASMAAQLPLARRLGDAPAASFDAIETLLASHVRPRDAESPRPASRARRVRAKRKLS